ncbi:ABC transporter permease/substrate binding protein [Leifsonia sp. NPDC058292]|uniref:ABC transporter permease/substrate binding protein n=1 Tax=Leifsonia sp. NPDC058292 TaxID=3346428 RepID=UPI0036DBF540
MDIRLPLGDWATSAVDFVTQFFSPVFDVIRTIFTGLFDGMDWVLQAPPFWVIILVFGALGLWLRGPVFGIGSVVGLLVIAGVDQWANAMDTLALVIVSALIAVALSVPLGILAARNKTASAIIRPVLDFMQTMPAFVYLIPALILFRVGVVPGIVATIIFAMAPGVRLTELGIRGVDSEIVEAGKAFGSSPRRILRQIQLPLAMPSILAGVNQVIMLSLSMVVIAGMVGAGGLGRDIVQALSRVDVGLGFEAGLSVVIIAIILDRLTAALGTVRKRSLAPAGARSRVRVPRKVVVAIGAVVVLAVAGTGISAAVQQSGGKGEIKVAVFNGWPEGEAVSYLWKHILEEKGYTVKFEYADAGPAFAGLSTGDYDVALDGWLPTTHATYLKKYSDSLEDLGAWNDEAKLTIAVNKDAPIDSLDELAAHASDFGDRLVGIEPGAGLTEATQNKVIPQYGLDKLQFITSSTPAMLAELTSAMKSKQNIAVTLWRPHWAYDQFDLKDLKDPKNTLGTAESLHVIGSKDFASKFPEAAGWFKDFRMDSDLLYSLENDMFNGAKSSDYDKIVTKWMSDHEDYVGSLTAGAKASAGSR